MKIYETVKEQKLVKDQQSSWTTLLTIPKNKLIADASFFTLRPYSNPNGKDADSLDVDIKEYKGCSSIGKKAFKIDYNYDKCEAILSFDKSKIIPTECSGFIIIKVSGNYNFHEMIKIPWSVDKLDLFLSENDIISPENIITWENGKEIDVLSFRVNCPEDVKGNGNIWYRSTKCPKIGLEPMQGVVSTKDFIISDETVDFDKEYKIKYKCIGEIDKTKDFQFELKIKIGSKVLKIHPLSLKFKPKCEVYILEINPLNEYTLNNGDTTLFEVTLKNNVNIGGATANLKAEISCATHKELFKLDKYSVNIKPQEESVIKLILNGNKLPQMPDNNIDIVFKLTATNEYTTFKDYSNNRENSEYKETITLKI